MAKDIEKRLRQTIRGLTAPQYPEPPGEMLRLDANTNLFGVNPALKRVLRGPLPDVAQYPSAFSDELLEALAKEHNLPPKQIVVGNGSDEIIDFVTKAFVNPGDKVAVAVPTFVMYPFYGRINFAEVAQVPLLPDFSLDADAIVKARAKLIFLSSPNNPTGRRFDDESIEKVLSKSGAVVVLDEAYVQYCDQDFALRIGDFDNLIVTRTFSKAYGLASCRIGYALCPEEIANALYRVKPPFTVGLLHERIAVEALKDKTFIRLSVEAVRDERARMTDELAKIGAGPKPTDANFMLVDTGKPSQKVASDLAKRGILVRNMAGFEGLETFIRVTVGRPEHTDALVKALKEIL